MSQIKSLASYIKQCLPHRALDGFSCVADEIKLEAAFKDIGENQLRTCLIYSKAVLAWDRFPYNECPPELVFSAVCMWISEQANKFYDEYELEQPAVELEVIDDKNAILIIEVSLVDEVFIKPDIKGLIPVNGKLYNVITPVVYQADYVDVMGSGAQ